MEFAATPELLHPGPSTHSKLQPRTRKQRLSPRADDRGVITQWLFLADETTQGLSDGSAGGEPQPQQPPPPGHQQDGGEESEQPPPPEQQQHQQQQQQRREASPPGVAPCVLAVQLVGPAGSVDFQEPSTAACLPTRAATPAAAPAPAARRTSEPGSGGGGGGGELRLLQLRNLVRFGSDWLGTGARLVNARGGETLGLSQMSAAQARARAPALSEWARTRGGELGAIQERLRQLVA